MDMQIRHHSDVYTRFKDYDKEFTSASSEVLFPPEIYLEINKYFGGAILDVGTGDGVKLDNLLQKCRTHTKGNIVAIDPSPLHSAAHERLKKYGNVEVQHVSLEDFKAEFLFDTILLFDVIEHSYTPDKILDRIVDLLKVNGTLVLSTPNKPVYDFAEKLFKGRLDPTHVHEMTISGLLKLTRRFFHRTKILGILPIMKIGRKIPFILRAHRLFACPVIYNTIIAIMQHPIKKR